MEYNATTHKGLLCTLLILLLGSLTISYFIGIQVFDALFYVRILFALFLVLLFFVRFKFVIDEGHLTFQTFFLSTSIYQKNFFPNQITQIKFVRIGWSTQCAVIKVKKGLNVRIANFTPTNVFNDLVEFADMKRISISKTKDYIILEK